jgi:PAS domain S-box-containing protein
VSTPVERVELLAVDEPAFADPVLLAAFEAAGDGLAVVELGSCTLPMLRTNNRLAELLETDAAVLRGASLADFTDAAGAATLADLAEMLGLGQETRTGDLMLRPGTPRQRWVRLTLTALRRQGLAGLAVATLTDISDTGLLERASNAPDALALLDPELRITDVTEARRRESTLRTQARVLETLREGVLLVRSDGVIRMANPAAARMFGAAGDSLIGAELACLGLDPRRLAQHVRDTAGTPGATIEWRANRLDGREDFVAEAAVVELRESPVDPPQVIAVIMDVTERRQLERAIIDAANHEQQRIGHDLHDGLGQELTGISLMLSSLARRAAVEYPSGAAALDEVVGLVNHAVESVRALAHGLSPVILERGGLPAALEQLAASASRTYGLRVRFRKAIEGVLQIDSTATHHLYRIAQEAVTNAARHSGASAVTLRLDANPHRIRMSVSDDGRGMPPAGDGTCNGDGVGLRIMEYRARMMHAQFQIVPRRRGGTQVRVTLPRCRSQGAV